MTCPQCGAQPRSSAAFCTACGASLVEQHEPGAVRPTPVKEMVGPERAAWIDSVWGAVETTDR